MSIYDAASHDELRRAAIALCCEAIDEKLFNSGVSKLTCAERIVPPVPRVLREYKGVTYSDELFWCADGCNYPSAAQCISDNATAQPSNKQVRLTDDDHAALLDLKTNPTVTPPTRERVIMGTQTAGVTTVHVDAEPTIADAIALLVREGWVDETRHMNRSRNLYMAAFKDHNDVPTRVLISPTPERAS